jgi:uncharacterized protein (TIGR03085 family)
VHRLERTSLLETLRDVGPAAPTLCHPWPASTMAAHIVVAERGGGAGWALALPLRRLLGARITTGAIRRLNPVMVRSMERAEGRGWPWLLERLAAGPPRLFRMAAPARVRLLEDWIHHEDIRRANGRGPRSADAALDQALLTSMQAVARLPEFTAPRQSLEATFPDGTVLRLSDRPTVRIAGPPGEVLLFVAGRVDVAQVEVEGDADEVAGLAATLAF